MSIVRHAQPQNTLTVDNSNNLIKPNLNLILVDFNYHNSLWEGPKTDPQGDNLENFLNNNNLVCLNDGSITFIADNNRGVITPNQIPLTTIVTYLQKKLQKQNSKLLGHYTCMQCGISHLQTVQENILSHIILATYRKFTVATVRFTQNVSCDIFTHPIYQQVTNVIV